MTQDFETYLQQARTEFCLVAHRYNVREHNELRTAIDSLLIAYDQAFLALRKHGVMQGLPSLEEIDSIADSVSLRARPNESRYDMYRGFQLGARWMKSKMSTEEQTGSPTVGQRSVDTVAERGDFSCWMSLGGGEQCKELCNECSGELARSSHEGQP